MPFLLGERVSPYGTWRTTRALVRPLRSVRETVGARVGTVRASAARGDPSGDPHVGSVAAGVAWETIFRPHQAGKDGHRGQSIVPGIR